MAAELEESEAGEETNEVEKTREDEDGDDYSTEKRGKHSKKHKHKHSKKHKHKHKKRKHKKRSPSRSRSKSSSRSRSRSPDSNDELEEETAKSDVADEADMKVVSSEENGIVKLESQNKTMSLGEETKDSTFEEFALAEVENLSFKLTKSPPSSVTCSPSSTPVNEAEVAKAVTKIPDVSKIENKVNLGFPMKIGSFPKSRSKSPDVSEEMLEGKRSRSPSDPEIKRRSKSPLDPETLNISQSPSDPKKSKSPQSKIKKVSRSHSRSRSRSRTKTQSRKSSSKSPRRHSKKKSRSSWSSRSRSRSRSRSKSGSRSRNKHRHSTKSKSRSRSPQRHKPRGRSRSRSPSLSRKKSRKRERSLGRSRKSRSRSPRKKSRRSHDSKTRDRSRSPTYRDGRSKRETFYDRKQDYSSRSRRSRSHENRYSRRSRSVTPPKSHRRRSHSRSTRRRRSRSPRRGRSRSPRKERHRYRSRSRSLSSRRRRSRSRSRSKDGHRRRSRSKSKEKIDIEEKKGGEKSSSEAPAVITNLNTNKPTAQDLVGKAPTVSDPSNKRSLAQLTEFCKKLTEARGIEIEGNATEKPTEEEEDDVSVEISHPFLVAPKKDITIPPVILPPMRPLAFPLVSSDKPLTEQFPVSCGTKHHEKEQEEVSVGEVIPYVDGSAHQPQQVFMPPQNQEKLDISGLVVKRMEAQRRLQADPNDLDAMLSLQEVEMKLNSWCQSNVKPGQFTGQLAKNMMPKEKMNTGYQAWARKDMFHNLNPISGGVGMKLLQKMGWEPGQVLGKRGQGMVEPIALTVKVDRKGLSSNTEKPVGKKGGGSKQIIDLQEKVFGFVFDMNTLSASHLVCMAY